MGGGGLKLKKKRETYDIDDIKERTIFVNIKLKMLKIPLFQRTRFRKG